MTIKRKLWDAQSWELKDHRDNTATICLKAYTPAQLSFMDWVDQVCVKNSKRYLPIRIDSWPAMDRYRRWEQAKPYRIMYVRLDEIKYLYNKRTWNKLVVELQ